MKINVFGTTISALVTAGCLAETGNDVTLIGQRQFEQAEPGLSDLLDQQQQAQRLKICKSPLFETTQQAHCHIIALGPDDCQEAKQIAAHLAEHADKASILIVRSNFTIGLAAELAQTCQLQFAVNPDFAADGHAIQAFVRPDRIIIGSDSEAAQALVAQLFAPFNRNKDVILNMTPASAELTKYATNALLATRISLMNELSRIAERIGADIEQVRLGLGSDSRIGRSYLYAGIGFGGDNFTRDLRRIQELLPEASRHGGHSLLKSVMQINNDQKELFFRKLWQHFDCQLNDRTITLWGLGYKPNTTSVIGAASTNLVNAFINQGCHLKLYDPFANKAMQQWLEDNLNNEQLGRVELFDDMYLACESSDALCVLTEYKAFWSPDLAHLKQSMQTPILLDGRNLYNRFWVEEQQFSYYGVGR